MRLARQCRRSQKGCGTHDRDQPFWRRNGRRPVFGYADGPAAIFTGACIRNSDTAVSRFESADECRRWAHPLAVTEQPPTRATLHAWIRGTLSLPPDAERLLVNAIDQVLLYHERVWRSSKDEALRAVATGFAQRSIACAKSSMPHEATSRNVARYFERVVADLTERTHRDAKTQLLHFRRFMEHVEIALSVDREGRWCALGVADITAFKALNDTLGHVAGDRVLERIADLLRSEVRCSDLLGYQPDVERPPALHARFGGDEFAFFCRISTTLRWHAPSRRFWCAVAEYRLGDRGSPRCDTKSDRGYRRDLPAARAAQRPSTQRANYCGGPSLRGRTAGSMK